MHTNSTDEGNFKSSCLPISYIIYAWLVACPGNLVNDNELFWSLPCRLMNLGCYVIPCAVQWYGHPITLISGTCNQHFTLKYLACSSILSTSHSQSEGKGVFIEDTLYIQIRGDDYGTGIHFKAMMKQVLNPLYFYPLLPLAGISSSLGQWMYEWRMVALVDHLQWWSDYPN